VVLNQTLISQCRQLSDARSSSSMTSRLLTTSLSSVDLPPPLNFSTLESATPEPVLRAYNCKSKNSLQHPLILTKLLGSILGGRFCHTSPMEGPTGTPAFPFR
jgi:hypothetical protein